METTLSFLQVHSCDESIFYVSSCAHNSELQYGLHRMQETGLQAIVDSTWRHDSELGRGYLLLSDSAGSGRIWRWEVGGGPIAIGRTLHMEQSGCRSKNHCHRPDAHYGSGGITMDFYSKEDSTEGKLVVAEWGEGRIVRLEENGARTPIVIQLPNLCEPETTTSVSAPKDMLFTIEGSLIFVDHQECGRSAIFQQKFASFFSPLESLKVSRDAHQWMDIASPSDEYVIPPPEVLYLSTDGPIGGLALSPTFRSVCFTTETAYGIILQRVPRFRDDEDEIILDFLDQSIFEKWNVFNFTDHGLRANTAGPITISKEGHVFVGVAESLAVLDPVAGQVLGVIEIGGQLTSLTIGDDGFLYITTSEDLFRIAIRDKPIKFPTDKVQKPLKKKQ